MVVVVVVARVRVRAPASKTRKTSRSFQSWCPVLFVVDPVAVAAVVAAAVAVAVPVCAVHVPVVLDLWDYRLVPARIGSVVVVVDAVLVFADPVGQRILAHPSPHLLLILPPLTPRS